MTIQKIILLAIFLAVITTLVIYNLRLKTRKTTESKLGRAPLSQEEGIAVATTSGTRAETDFNQPRKDNEQAPKSTR